MGRLYWDYQPGVTMADTTLTFVVKPNGQVNISVNGQSVGCIQSLHLDLVADADGGKMHMNAYFPDCDLGWANANILKQVPGCNAFWTPLK